MAVYTQLSKADIDDFIAQYDIGALVSFEPIAEGVTNTNYLITVSPSPLAGEGGGEGSKRNRSYSPYIKEFARSLRSNQTDAEKKIWELLRNNNSGFKFRRQFAVDNKYIADFICLEKRLIIEIDGGQHSENKNDIERTLYLESQDFRIIRLWNNEVLENLDGCYQILLEELGKDTPHPNPPPQGGRGYSGTQQEEKKYILTLFEKHFEISELPYFTALMHWWHSRGISCPEPIAMKGGRALGALRERPALLVSFLEGSGVKNITPEHMLKLGEITARMHIAGMDFPHSRPNHLSVKGWEELVDKVAERADEIEPGLRRLISEEYNYLSDNWPDGLPRGPIHADLFPDNVFFNKPFGGKLALSGVIDLYFSCNDFWAYDLAIVINAWCFDDRQRLLKERVQALMAGYNEVRGINEDEEAAFALLLRGSALRFLLTRAYDWLNRDPGALVEIKDPLEYARKLEHWQSGKALFK